MKILNAKNLPVMKKLTKSTDAYCEVTLTNCHVGEGKLVQRTSTAWEDLYPKWNESISFKRLRYVPTLCLKTEKTLHNYLISEYNVNTNNNSSIFIICSQIDDVSINFNVRDATKRPTGEDAVIGYCDLPIDLLLNQKRHIFVIALNMPEKRSKSLPIMVDGALRVEAKLFYSRSLLLQQRISDIEQQISEFQERRDDEIFNDVMDDKAAPMTLSKTPLQANIATGEELNSSSADNKISKNASIQSSSSFSSRRDPTSRVPTAKSVRNAELKAKLQQEADASSNMIKRPGKVRAIVR